MEASPAPKTVRRPRRWWLWGLLVLSLGLIVGASAVYTFPRWGAQRVRVALEARLTARLGQPVTIQDLSFDWNSMRMVHLRMDTPIVDLKEIEVELADHALWSLGAEAKEIRIRGGRVSGTRAQVETLARVVLEAAAKQASEQKQGWRGRVKLRPESLEIKDLEFDLMADEGPLRALRAQVFADLRPRQESGSLRLESVEADAEFFGSRHFYAEAIETSVSRRAGALTFPLELDVTGGAFALTQQIALSQVDGRVVLADAQASEVEVDLTGGFGRAKSDGPKGRKRPAGTALWSLSGKGKRDLSQGSMTLAMDAFELGRVPQALEHLPLLVDSEKGTIAGELSVDFADGKAQVDGKLRLDGLNVEHRVLAREVVRDIDFAVDLRAKVDPSAYRVELDELSIERHGAKLIASGSVVHPPTRELRKYQLKFEVPDTDCQVILNAVPAQMIPSLRGLRVSGHYTAKVELDVDFSRLDDLSLDTQVRPRGCTVESVPPALSLARLRNGFTHRMTMRDGRQRMVRLFDGSSSYASLSQISPSMISAVLTTEDAGFWRHSGFLSKQFGEALRRNLKAGRVRLGASTITMQMVKNVFLSHERTLSRKFQELVLTEYVERALGKNRIMELYLNVIEFGPGIYGVRAASEHYFGKHPRDLSSLESAYLALMLPSPVRRHVHFCKGQLSASFDRKLRMIHGLMFSRGHISEGEYLLWKDAELLFDPLRDVDQGSCLGEISRLLEAQEGQHAITGLLGDAPPTHDDIVQEIEPREVELPDLELPSLDDPANSDAPGVPAMEQ